MQSGGIHTKLIRLLQPVKLNTVSILSTDDSNDIREVLKLIHVRAAKYHRQNRLLQEFYESLEPQDRKLSLYQVYKQSQKERNSRYWRSPKRLTAEQ